MKTQRVQSAESLELSVLKSNPPILQITATGINPNNNYTNIRLEPRVYILPPSDGIWEFDFIGDVPEITDQIETHVSAAFEWKDFPAGVKGIKVYAARNSKVAMLLQSKVALSAAGSGKIELLKAEAWVNTQPVQPTVGGTLYVNIVYNSNNPGFHNLQPAVPQGINPAILLLEITDSPEMIFIFNPRQNSYSQGLESAGQYTEISLLYEGEIIGSITNIPVVS